MSPYPVTHALGIAPERALYDDWAPFPDVHYLVASCVHSDVVAALVERNRSLTFFHSALGFANPPNWEPPGGRRMPNPNGGGRIEVPVTFERWLYDTLYPPTMVVGYGINAVVRAVCLAMGMGFRKIYVLGADCALRTDGTPLPPRDLEPEFTDWCARQQMHAGRQGTAMLGPKPLFVEAVTNGTQGIGGVPWVTTVDMLISAQSLARLQLRLGERLEIVGPSMASVFAAQGAEWMDTLPQLSGEESIQGLQLQILEPSEKAGRPITISATVDLTNPEQGHYEGHIRHNAALCQSLGARVAHLNSRLRQTVVICGAGPSLESAAARAVLAGRWQELWACNSALPYLLEAP